MRLFEAFAKKAPNKVFTSIVLGAIAGIGYSALIPLIMLSVRPRDETFSEIDTSVETFLSLEVAQYEIAILFFVACIAILFIRTISEVILLRVATLVAKDYRVRFYEQISAAPISALEKIGSSKLVTSINIDVPRVVMGARIFPSLLVNSVSLIGMLGFLLYLNYEVFKLVMVAIVFGVIAYQIPMLFGRRIFTRARHIRDDLQEGLRGLVLGSKELKLNKEKREAFFKEVLIKSEDEVLVNEKRAHTIVNATASFGELLAFFVIGLVSFVFINYHSVSQEELVGVVMALLYLVGPMGIILNSIPQLTVSFVSVRKITHLLKQIPREEVNTDFVKINDWNTIHFSNVEYQYESKDDEPGFQIGPVDFDLHRGRVTFIIGGNGSGKSTLSKLITLHYLPNKGNIRFGSNSLSEHSVETLRQEVSAIYSDYFLFDRLLGKIDEKVLQEADKYLERLNLSEKVTINDGRFSTIALSDGQKKRLALLVAFLEDKNLYLFDEWAADQDPTFKRVFYRDILPELKRKNKAVVVISHDEHYFDVADDILVMDQGKLAPREIVSRLAKNTDSLVTEFC